MQIFQKFFKGSGARLKLIAILLFLIFAVVFAVYRYNKSKQTVSGVSSHVTSTPDIASVPGTKALSPSYTKLLLESNQQAAQQALRKGTSAIPTVVNTGIAGQASQLSTTGSCQAFCDQWSACGSCQSGKSSTNALLSGMVGAGNVSPVVAAQLTKLATGCTLVSDYAAALNKFVKQNRLTPDQSQQLLTAYRNEKANITPSQLLSQLGAANQISVGAASQIRKLNKSEVTPADYATALNQLAQQGKLTTSQPACLLSAYRKTYKALSPSDLLNQLVAEGKISPELAKQINSLNAAGLSCEDYKAAMNKLSQNGKLSPALVKQLSTSYCTVHPAGGSKPKSVKTPLHRDLTQGLSLSGKLPESVAKELQALSDKNASAAAYAAELNRLVAAGKISACGPAQQLLKSYREQHGDTTVSPSASPAEAQTEEAQQKKLLKIQLQILAKQAVTCSQQKKQPSTTTTTTGASAADQQAQQALVSAQQQAIQQQAAALFSSWTPPTQTYIASSVAAKESAATGQAASESGKGTSKTGKKATSVTMVKAGAIMFAVLDTGLNSDRPGPVMATMVSGKFKGAKLMGALTLTPDGERVMLKFTTLIKNDWPDNITISAVAINPDTAHTAIASDVNHHYMLRLGSLFASNFLAGYGQAISQSGSTVTNTSGVSTNTTPNLSGADKALMALGQVGTALSQYAGKWMNIPATVRVDAGVGLGILFTENVETPTFLEK